MRTLTVPEAQTQLAQIIAEVNRGEVIVLTDGDQEVTLYPGGASDLEEDSAELEAELLKAAKGPFSAYSEAKLDAIGNRIIEEQRRK